VALFKKRRTSKDSNPYRDLEHKHQCNFFAAISHVNHPAVALTGCTLGGYLKKPTDRLRAVREGYRPGCPDLYVMWPSKGYHGLWIELKIAPNKPSPEQLETLQRLRAAGYEACVAWSWDEAFKFWCEYLGISVELRR
jgi:hypothetical protein